MFTTAGWPSCDSWITQVAGKSLRLLILINLFAPLPRLVRWQRIAALRSILITKQYHEWKFMENHLFQARFGRPGAFVAALQKLRGKGTDISEEAKEIKVPKKKTVNLLMFYCKLFFFSDLLWAIVESICSGFHRKASEPAKGQDVGPVSEGLHSCCYSEYLKYVLYRRKMLLRFSEKSIRGQVGVGLMALQQFGGVNGICFYASEIFVSAGNELWQNLLPYKRTFPCSVVRKDFF
jgi:hypothetical protein